jgi:hypothetical protein
MPLGLTLTDAMAAVPLVPVEPVEALARQFIEPPPSEARSRPARPATGRWERTSVSEALERYWPGCKARPGETITCPLHQDSKPSLSIAHDDLRVWCKSPTCVLYREGGRDSIDLARIAEGKL